MSATAESNAVRTFRVNSPVQQMGGAAVACVIVLAIIFFLLPPSQAWIILLVGAVLLLSLGLIYWLLTLTRLTISSDGITYYAIGYRVSSTWANVKGYGTRVLGAESVESLILAQSSLDASGWVKTGYAVMPAAQVAAAAQGRVIPSSNLKRDQNLIPVGAFDKDWRTGELGALIKQYAPQAFDTHVTN